MDNHQTFTSSAAAGVHAAGQACAALAVGAPAVPPRVVTTGRKIGKSATAACQAVDLDTGEPVEIGLVGSRLVAVRHPQAYDDAPSDVGFIDALAFSVVPPDGHSFQWVIEQMRTFVPVDEIDMRKGCFGFTNSLVFGEGAGLVAWGGKSQRGRVYFGLMGKGCSLVSDWPGLSNWLQSNGATIKRCDLAHDDHEGQHVSIGWAIEQYQGDGFTAGGRKPKHSVFGDWLAGDEATSGRTLAIGNRASGKYCRIYEKGRQLGDAASAWTRVEVELRAKDRWIPYDVLTRPGHYLAGCYPCLAFLSEIQSTVKTVVKAAQIAFDKAVDHAKQACGKLVNLMLTVSGGDFVDVVQRLRRDGIPARIAPYSYQVRGNPAMLDPDLREVPA